MIEARFAGRHPPVPPQESARYNRSHINICNGGSSAGGY